MTKTSKSFVFKSIDPVWPKWAAVLPDKLTQWFATREEADAAIADGCNPPTPFLGWEIT